MGRQRLLESVASTIADYRRGEVPAPDAAHVERWLCQFDAALQLPLLAEMDHVLRRCYLSQAVIARFLAGVVERTHLTGGNSIPARLRNGLCRCIHQLVGVPRYPRQWRRAQLLEIQQHGGSQHAMAAIFRDLLTQRYGPPVVSNPRPPLFIYLDDVLFTGTRVIIDLDRWIRSAAPPHADVVVVVIACYTSGLIWAHQAIRRAATEVGKTIRLHWIRALDLDNRPWRRNRREAFHPASLPDDPIVKAYVEELGHAGRWPRLRVPEPRYPSRIFSSEQGRHLLEQQFLLAGLRIRAACRRPDESMRPLGYDVAPGLGFGGTLLTHRNCPNNCPLAWWWGVPASAGSKQWYPLFPRKV